MTFLKAGPLSIQYVNGFLRYIRYGEHEVLRMMYFALRDENWRTYSPIIKNESISFDANGFHIQYDCFHENEGMTVFKWNVAVEGSMDGTILFQIEGEVLSEILKNRAGFCILHAIKESMGQPVEITHGDETVSHSNFPTYIDPQNPFKKIKKMRWKINGSWFTLDFEGDLFETEDQRNWSDASFKTFCTPLEIPFPVKLKAKERILQKIRFRTETTLIPRKDVSSIVKIEKGSQLLTFPKIGIGASTETIELSSRAIDQLKTSGFSHYSIEAQMQSPAWRDQFAIDLNNSLKLGLPLDVALHLTANFKEELLEFVLYCRQAKADIKNILLVSRDKLVTNQDVFEHAAILKGTLPSVKIGAGTVYNFTELNRNRFAPKHIDFISFSIDPQEHAVDDLTIIENLETQIYAIESARHMYPDVSIHVCPITLRRRANPYATTPADREVTNEKQADPRQLTSFCPAWTMGSIKKLTQSGAASVTYYQSAGKQGLLSLDGQPYPVLAAFQRILQNQHLKIIRCTSSQPLIADAVIFENGRVIAWNYTPAVQKMMVGHVIIELGAHEIKEFMT